jgi:hypothetical protein
MVSTVLVGGIALILSSVSVFSILSLKVFMNRLASRGGKIFLKILVILSIILSAIGMISLAVYEAYLSYLYSYTGLIARPEPAFNIEIVLIMTLLGLISGALSSLIWFAIIRGFEKLILKK